MRDMEGMPGEAKGGGRRRGDRGAEGDGGWTKVGGKGHRGQKGASQPRLIPQILLAGSKEATLGHTPVRLQKAYIHLLRRKGAMATTTRTRIARRGHKDHHPSPQAPEGDNARVGIRTTPAASPTRRRPTSRRLKQRQTEGNPTRSWGTFPRSRRSLSRSKVRGAGQQMSLSTSTPPRIDD